MGFIIGLLFTSIVLSLYYVIKFIAGNAIADRFAYFFTKFWGKSVILSTGSVVSVHGIENLSSDIKVCYVCNHQSYFDIPLLMGWLRRPIGFVAKKELLKVPVLNGWISAIHSVFLDRRNARSAIVSINKGIDIIKKGNAIAFFPEGTRSKDGNIAPFKVGSIKLALSSSATIQPVTICHTRDVFEAHKKIEPSHIELIIHKAINPEEDIYKDKNALIEELYTVINKSFIEHEK